MSTVRMFRGHWAKALVALFSSPLSPCPTPVRLPLWRWGCFSELLPRPLEFLIFSFLSTLKVKMLGESLALGTNWKTWACFPLLRFWIDFLSLHPTFWTLSSISKARTRANFPSCICSIIWSLMCTWLSSTWYLGKSLAACEARTELKTSQHLQF